MLITYMVLLNTTWLPWNILNMTKLFIVSLTFNLHVLHLIYTCVIPLNNTTFTSKLYVGLVNPGKSTKNRWLTCFPLPADEFAFLCFVLFSGVSHLMSQISWETGSNRKQYGRQWQCYGGYFYIYFMRQFSLISGNIYASTSGTSTCVNALEKGQKLVCPPGCHVSITVDSDPITSMTTAE